MDGPRLPKKNKTTNSDLPSIQDNGSKSQG